LSQFVARQSATNSSNLRAKESRTKGALQKKERVMDMSEGVVERNRNIIIAAAVVVVILVIIYLYTAGHLSGIVWGEAFTRASDEAASVGGLAAGTKDTPSQAFIS
jgi:hypothetical protein